VKSFAVFRRVNWWLVLVAGAISVVGLVFIRSATMGDEFSIQPVKQVLFLAIAAGFGFFLLLVPYGKLVRCAWPMYGLAVLGLALLPFFAPVINGARRWYILYGISLQPSEVAKPAVILALASYLRFKSTARTMEGLMIPMAITALPVFLVLKQPDLGSSLVFWPVLLAMCYAAGTPARSLLVVLGLAVGAVVLAFLFSMHDYQRQRIEVWGEHFTWTEEDLSGDLEVQGRLRDAGYQPWQSLVAIGSGGLTGFGLHEGPQNRYDFLTYRSVDYIFSVITEETGLLGAYAVLGLQAILVLGLLSIALQTRERFGRLLAVGVATYLGTQMLIHTAVCTWLVPATGLPMPLVSYGGSSTLAAACSIALVLNVGARREPVLGADGFH
jgi:cell division protein FtsW (lipid II flippase)